MQPGQLQDGEYLSLRSNSQSKHHEKLSESGGREKQAKFHQLKSVLLGVGIPGTPDMKRTSNLPQYFGHNPWYRGSSEHRGSPATGLGVVYASRETRAGGV